MEFSDIWKEVLEILETWTVISSKASYLLIPLALTVLVSIPMYFLKLSKNLIIVTVLTIVITSYTPLIIDTIVKLID